jgi:hypothetical protein
MPGEELRVGKPQISLRGLGEEGVQVAFPLQEVDEDVALQPLIESILRRARRIGRYRARRAPEIESLEDLDHARPLVGQARSVREELLPRRVQGRKMALNLRHAQRPLSS